MSKNKPRDCCSFCGKSNWVIDRIFDGCDWLLCVHCGNIRRLKVGKNKARDLSAWLLKREGISLSREEIWALALKHVNTQGQWTLYGYEHGIPVQQLADACDVHISAIYRRLEKVAKVLYRASVGGAR